MKSDNAVKVAVIGLIGTIAAAILASPVLLRLIERSPGDDPDEPPALTEPPPFVTDYVYDLSDIERVEFEYDADSLPPESTEEFIEISRVAFSGQGQLFHVQVTISNTTTKPLVLTLDSRYFSLVDDRGMAAQMVYFCCPADGDVLGPGQQRTIELFFQSKGWYGKELAASAIFFRVRGFLPLIRASWKMHVLATMD